MVQLTTPSIQHENEHRPLLIRNCSIWTDQGILKGAILTRNGKIARIAREISDPTAQRVDASGLLALPGLIDPHVHLRDMDLSYKEDFYTGTSAAAAGGFTTVLDMPNTQPPTDSLRRLQDKTDRAAGTILTNVGFHAAAITETETIRKLGKAGAFSLKLYLPSPISQLPVENDSVLTRMMITAARSGLPITVHAEDPRKISKPINAVRSFFELARCRPPEAEFSAIARILRLQRFSKCRIHFCHLTIPSAITCVSRRGDARLSTEVTPHHVILSQGSLRTKGWKAWMIPPLRSEIFRRGMLSAVVGGSVTMVGSDHAPHTTHEKEKPVAESPPGVPGLETTLRLFLTLVNKNKITLAGVVELLAKGPARVFGLSSKAQLREGLDADIVLVNMKARSRIRPETFFSKAKFTPFEGRETRGKVHTTIVGGQVVYQEGEIVAPPGTGTVLKREIHR